MSDTHTGLSHDLPDYVPNLPLAADLRRQVRSKARIYKEGGYWHWRHDCGDQTFAQLCLPSQPFALTQALRHLRRCR